MTTGKPQSDQAIDLSECSREPIHIPGRIQSYGMLLAVREPDMIVLQASSNVEQWFGIPAERAAGSPVAELIGPENFETLRRGLPETDSAGEPAYLGAVSATAGEARFHATAHRQAGVLIIEFERLESASEPTLREMFPLLRSARNVFRAAYTVEELSRIAAKEIRELTGFDRVLLYKFDEDWNGHVVAEDKRSGLAPYLDLWFPASDIPAQARELYRVSPIRLIADANDAAVAMIPEYDPETGRPLDMSRAILRGVSPVHLEYLQNMGVTASMSISILRGDRLWGLIACHHTSARATPIEVRMACDLLARAFSAQLSVMERADDLEYRIRVRGAMTRLLACVAKEKDLVDGLVLHPDDLLGFLNAEGAAVIFEGRCMLVGNTPPEDQTMRIAEWLAAEAPREGEFHTDCLSDLLPGSDVLRREASGILAISISQLHDSYVVWFRPEVVRTVKWGGDPSKAVERNGEEPQRLHPRRSFAEWKQIVRARSAPWKQAEVDAAIELRNAIISIVLRNAEEMADLSAELQRSNRELEAFSYSVSHDLRAPFRHISGFAELLREHLGDALDDRSVRYISTIIESAQSAGALVDHLLNYSRIGRAKLYRTSVDMQRLVRDAVRETEMDHGERAIEWRIGELPSVQADASMMRVVLTNLTSNAAKYSRGRHPAIIEIGAERVDKEVVFRVSDNGVGFDQRYVDKLFGVFQRLHKEEDYEGSGIGLANVRRIIARHGGRTWAQGEVGKGATVWFSLPAEPAEET